MSASTGVNVLRYSALAFGVFYGFTHQRSISATANAAAAKREYEHKQHLIEQAKAEFSKKKNPPQTSSGLDQDPMSSSFDLEKFFDALSKENP